MQAVLARRVHVARVDGVAVVQLHGRRNHPLPSELTSATIASTGLGLRFSAGAYANVQLDYGHAVHTGDVHATSKNRLHVRVALAY